MRVPSPSSSPTRGPAGPNDDTVADNPKNTRDWVSSDSSSSRGSSVDPNLDTASRDCLFCLDTDDICMRMTCKKYRKRVSMSCKSSKGVDWTDAQMKKIKGGHQDVWGQNYKIIRAKQRLTLADNCTPFKMRWMTTRTDQLIHIAKVTGSKFYTSELEVRAQGLAKVLVLSLEQFHAQYYRLYKKRPTKAMVGLQGLHSSDAFQHLNVLTSVGLKSFCPWCLNFWGNAKTIATHLRKVHYRLAIACNAYWSFASMSVQVVLEHRSKCRVKSHKNSKLKK